MPPEAQALMLRNIEENGELARAELSNTCGVVALSRDPYGFGELLAELRALDPANDDRSSTPSSTAWTPRCRPTR